MCFIRTVDSICFFMLNWQGKCPYWCLNLLQYLHWSVQRNFYWCCLFRNGDRWRLLRIYFVNKCIDYVDKIKVNEKLWISHSFIVKMAFFNTGTFTLHCILNNLCRCNINTCQALWLFRILKKIHNIFVVMLKRYGNSNLIKNRFFINSLKSLYLQIYFHMLLL